MQTQKHLPLLETISKINDRHINLRQGSSMTSRIGLGLYVLFLLSWWSQGEQREIIGADGPFKSPSLSGKDYCFVLVTPPTLIKVPSHQMTLDVFRSRVKGVQKLIPRRRLVHICTY